MDKDVKQGDLMAAEPFMLDSPFRKTVILMCEHSRDEGSIGFIINKGTQFRIDELIQDFPECDAPVFYGGPVSTNTIHYIHRVGDLLENSREVCPGIYWGGDFEKMKFLIQNKVIQSMDIKFFIGYSGWSPGQIYDELKEGSWIVSDADINYVFRATASTWANVVEQKGDTFKVMADMANYTFLN